MLYRVKTAKFVTEMIQNIYVISGLGADHTVFCRLNLPGYQFIHVKWVEPVKGESLGDYAKRLLPQITGKNPIILGLSLGGMLALEVAKLIPTKRVISLSSATNYSELPFRYKLAGGLRLQKILPVYAFARGNRFTYWIFGVKKKEDKVILDEVFINLNKGFLYWALNAVLNWDNEVLPKNLNRIHGTSDLILPLKKTSEYDEIVQGGTHLMLLNQPKDVIEAIMRQLKDTKI